MTEELVTLETAKLLKEKGFNEFCEFAYADEDLHIMGLHSTNSFFNEILHPLNLSPKSGCVKPRTCILKYPICMEIIGYMIY